MTDPLDQIQYLVMSKNRVRVLEYLSEAPADREELSEQLDIPRSTLSRVLTGLEAQNWISQHGSDCNSTPLGAVLADEFTSLKEAVETMQHLEDVIDYLPVDETDFELNRLRDATITTPTQTDPGAPVRRARELLHEANEFRFLTNTVVSPLVETLREQTVQGELTLVGVITGDLLDAVSDSPEFRERTREMIESGSAEFYRYDGSVSQTLGVADETVAVITQIDRDGNQRAQFETDDRYVCSWVVSTIEEHRREAEQIRANTLAE
ncbi:helix-turn-helix transcriptional regulator [Halobaculum magnesiiphilum]|uniref:Helix-turn-helix domain-containing protein n=1 Tax=Halobaculum magnesiiphilum TaxID=1017351 RepID=A0A8T8WIL2_9EURY|nr:helix-turn-helix domain-containing protein [Halobaculum magnesiiphilum]QZP39563.1 helix-turn-helix domain-containing protein [Halobaculum magnesiiphilum]